MTKRSVIVTIAIVALVGGLWVLIPASAESPCNPDYGAIAKAHEEISIAEALASERQGKQQNPIEAFIASRQALLSELWGECDLPVPTTTVPATTVPPTTIPPTTAPPTTVPPTTTPPTTIPPGSYPPPSTEGDNGRFRVECDWSHAAQVDPIVNPGPQGTLSQHLHEFFGNTSTDSDSTYLEMLQAGTTCTADGDTAAYWSPALLNAQGQRVQPSHSIVYYRNRPSNYGTTIPFPADLRIIAGGVQADAQNDVTYWTCVGESDTGFGDRKNFIPTNCNDGMRLHIWFPSCWDGVNTDSADHRSHMAYGTDNNGTIDPTDPDICPQSHPVKVPQLNFRVQYDVNDGTGYKLADGTVLPHADFWNTWDQSELTAWIHACHNANENCDLASGDAP